MGQTRFKNTFFAGCLVAALGFWCGPSVWAQGSDSAPGYQVGEGDQSPPVTAADNGPAPGSTSAADADNGPVRLARFSYLKGSVSWRPGDTVAWAPATDNLPMRQGAQIWASGHSRAEVQFDDGSYLRLGADAVVTLQTLYSDAQGEFTELRLSQGLASLSLPHDRSVFQIDTLTASIKAAGPAKVRVGVNHGTEIAVREGKANIEDAQGKTFLEAGDYVDVTDAKAPFNIEDLPPADGWDTFTDERDRVMAEAAHDKNLSSQEGLVAGNLDDYGQWHSDPTYGEVWAPAEPAGWTPYHDGHWVWVDPFGWTWVGDEPWGWAPYHYGTWTHLSYGWGWCPGPRLQYWSPAVVDFTGCNGDIGWAPLAPFEVSYPSLTFGFGFPNWSLFFSIGGCADYTWGGGRYCYARPWHNDYINRWDFRGRFADYHNFPDTARPGFGGHGFIPANARFGGASQVRAAEFGGTGRFESVPRSQGAGLWTRGHSVTPTGGVRPFSGPATVRPTMASLTPTHTFQAGLRAPQSLARPVYRAGLAPNIARVSGRSGAFLAPSNRVASPGFRGGAAAFGGRTAFGGGPAATGRAFHGGGRTFAGAGAGRGSFNSGSQAAERARESLGVPRQSGGGGFRGADGGGAYFHQRALSGGSPSSGSPRSFRGAESGGSRSFSSGSGNGGGFRNFSSNAPRSFGGGGGSRGGGSRSGGSRSGGGNNSRTR